VPAAEVAWGNAVDEGSQKGRRGWFVGHFLPQGSGPAATERVEVKWDVHAAGELKAIEGINQTAATMSLLVSGRFRLDSKPPSKRDTGSPGRLRGLVARGLASVACAGRQRGRYGALALTTR
jgi:hypothetical protein